MDPTTGASRMQTNEAETQARISQLAIQDAKRRMSQKYPDFAESELKVVNIVKTCFDSFHLGGNETRYAAMSVTPPGYSVTLQYKDESFTLNTLKGDKFVLEVKRLPKN